MTAIDIAMLTLAIIAAANPLIGILWGAVLLINIYTLVETLNLAQIYNETGDYATAKRIIMDALLNLALFGGAKILEKILPAIIRAMDDVRNCLRKNPEEVFERVKTTTVVGDNINLTTIDDLEFKFSRTGLKSEFVANGMSEDAAETAIKYLEDGCFSGETIVLTKNGQKRIDEIHDNELVLAKDVYTGETAYKPVKHVYIKSTTNFVVLNLEGEQIRTTASHLFFTDSGWWKAAENLRVGDKVFTSSNTLKAIISISFEKLAKPERIYNLNVEDYHTYFVGTQALLVHNNCGFSLDDIASTTGKSLNTLINENLGKVVTIRNKRISLPSAPHGSTPGHWDTMVNKAIDLAQNSDAEEIWLNKGLSNFQEINKIEEAVIKALKDMDYSSKASEFVRIENNGAKIGVQYFNNNLMMLATLSPKGFDDIDFGVGLALMNLAKSKCGPENAILIDCHNCFKGEKGRILPGNKEVFDLMGVVERIETYPQYDHIKMGCYGDPIENMSKEEGVGESGVKVMVLEVNQQKTAYILLDANNMVEGFREKIIDHVKKLGLDNAEVMTTDTHSINTLAGGHNPVGMKKQEEIISIIGDCTIKAVEDLENVEVGVKVAKIRGIKTLGPTNATELVTTISSIVAVSRIFAPFIFILALFFVFIWIFYWAF